MKHLTTLLLLTASLSAHSSPPHLCDSTFREASSRAMELALKQTKQFNQNNRTMNKIKSDRAKERLEHGVGEAHEFTYDLNVVELSMAESAIIFAEQDAEERAVRFLEDFIAEGLLLTKEDEIVSKFKLLLNGGQSDV